MLPTPGSTLDIPVILNVVDVEMWPFLGLYVLDGNNLIVDKVSNHLWNHIVTNRNSSRFEDIWKIKLIRKGEYLYVPPSTSTQLFYNIKKLRDLRKQLANLSATRLCKIMKKAGTKAVSQKTLERLEYLLSTCEPCQKIKTVPKHTM